MNKIVIRNDEDLVNALPLLINYRPDEGSVIVMDAAAQPVGVLYPALLAEYDHHNDASDIVLADNLRVFNGRKVVLIRIGFHAPLAFVERAVALAGGQVIHRVSVAPGNLALAYAGTKSNRTREQYITEDNGQAKLDADYERSKRETRERNK